MQASALSMIKLKNVRRTKWMKYVAKCFFNYASAPFVIKACDIPNHFCFKT